MPNSVTRAQIESYDQDVLRNKVRCDLPLCPGCHSLPDSFRRHQARPRTFYILCDLLVHVLRCLVIRWKCPGCNKTFTQQPPFALPRKRYTRETILDYSGYYLNEEPATYRGTVLEESSEIFHASTSKEEPINNRSLAHSTPYRWITSLGGFKEIQRCAQDLVLQKNPASGICRHLAALEIAPGKHKTAARKAVLRLCRQLIHLELEFRATFRSSIFPFFATSCAWR